MLNKVHPVRSKIGQFVCIVGIEFLLFALLVCFVTNTASAGSYESDGSASLWNSNDSFHAMTLQGPATPTITSQVESTSTYSFSLAALGYTEETTLNSPFDSAQYSFRTPENWSVTDVILDLDLSYVYDQFSPEEQPALFGDLAVTLDDQILEYFPIEEELDHYRLRVPLPLSLLADSDRPRHVIGLALEAGLLCEVPHRAALVIHPTSSISLAYNQRPLVPNLSRYPWPFFQQAFESDRVRFVLSSRATADDLVNTLAIAAKLGDLTGNRLAISATTDLDLGDLLSTDPVAFDEHLIVIGQPQDNQLLPLLSDVAELPVSLHQQQLDFIAQGPSSVAPGDTFAYVFTVTNTVDQAVDLSLINPLPAYTEFVDCAPDCTENSDDGVVTWSDNILAPAESLNFSLTLRATDTLTGATLENTVTLVEADSGPVNADTLTSTVVTDSSSSGVQVSVASQDDYFFVYDGKAVARGDGIVQEVLSPWSESRVILIITGLSDEAIRKASHAMSSETRFPGMSGAVALVRDVLSPSEVADLAPTAVEVTFEDLGYPDQVIYGESSQQFDYRFEAPAWQLADDAAIDLYFSHSQLIDYEDSGLTVLLNREPVASVVFSDETSSDGHIHINLANANVWMAQINRLSLQVNMSLQTEQCMDPSARQEAWFLIKGQSKIFWSRGEDIALSLDLGYFPYPFHKNRSLADLLFALPDDSTASEWETALRLAADLGSSAAGRTIVPAVVIGGDVPAEDLKDYHIIAIGRPSRNSLIQQVNAQLPQPFLSGSDEIEQRLDGVTFRLPSGIDLGYLQLIPSPWNEARAFLVVTGTTDEGMKEAARILVDRRWVLGGDLILVRDDEVNTIDTRRLISGGVAAAVASAVPEMTPTGAAPTATPTVMATTLPTSVSPSPTPGISSSEEVSGAADRPTWLIPLVLVNGLIALAVLAVAFWRARRRRL